MVDVKKLKIEQLYINNLESIHCLSCEQFGTESWSKQQIKDSLNSKSTRFYGIFLNSQLICFASILETLDDITLLDIATTQEYKKLGLAKKMMSFLILQKKEEQTFSLEVKSKNTPAINLYKSFGFKTLNIRKKYYKDGDDALCMFLN